jgi:ABC-type lipoprotein export system ATPase subunit
MLLVLGPSGCGKTTLLSSGRATPTDEWNDPPRRRAVETLDRRSLDAYRRRVGIIFQAFNLVDSLTATENVAVPLRSAGTSERQARQRAVRCSNPSVSPTASIADQGCCPGGNNNASPSPEPSRWTRHW